MRVEGRVRAEEMRGKTKRRRGGGVGWGGCRFREKAQNIIYGENHPGTPHLLLPNVAGQGLTWRPQNKGTGMLGILASGDPLSCPR